LRTHRLVILNMSLRKKKPKAFLYMGCVVTIFGYLQYCSRSSIVIITAGDYEYCESNSFRGWANPNLKLTFTLILYTSSGVKNRIPNKTVKSLALYYFLFLLLNSASIEIYFYRFQFWISIQILFKFNFERFQYQNLGVDLYFRNRINQFIQ
jgi:hypothetical protein